MPTPNIYVIVDSSAITNKLLNLSTSRNLEEVAKLANGKYVLEFEPIYKLEILDYKWYTADEIKELQQKEPSWLDSFFSLFS